MTTGKEITVAYNDISTHTLRGERDLSSYLFPFLPFISTHTLRGERDFVVFLRTLYRRISTHTLRGERDKKRIERIGENNDFNSHAPWGA